MNNIITKLDLFINEEFLGIGKDREYDPDDYKEYVKFKGFIDTIIKYPHYAVINKEGMGIFFNSQEKSKRFQIENLKSGLYINDDLSAPSSSSCIQLNICCHITRDSDLYGQSLKLFNSAVKAVKNDFREIKYR
jgi:hypothetical protein